MRGSKNAFGNLALALKSSSIRQPEQRIVAPAAAAKTRMSAGERLGVAVVIVGARADLPLSEHRPRKRQAS